MQKNDDFDSNFVLSIKKCEGLQSNEGSKAKKVIYKKHFCKKEGYKKFQDLTGKLHIFK